MLSQLIRKRDCKTLGTSVLNRPMSTSSLTLKTLLYISDFDLKKNIPFLTMKLKYKKNTSFEIIRANYLLCISLKLGIFNDLSRITILFLNCFISGREETLGYLLRQSPKFYNCVFLFVSLKVNILGGLYFILIGCFIKLSVQTFQALILIYRWGNFVHHQFNAHCLIPLDLGFIYT